MPRVNLSEVISFSSEDPNHPADNLLSAQSFRKWKIYNNAVGSEASVTLKLEHLSAIRSVDIGNDGCAFVEVLVARDDDKFEVLLPSSSFMSPVESRNLKDMNRVRMFAPEKLTKLVAEQKWSRVKVVCTQPFNKQLQFGLAFITLNAPETASSNSKSEVKVGKFVLKEAEDEDDGERLVAGALFAKLREKTAAAPSTAGTTEAVKRKIPDDIGFYQLKKKKNTTSENASSASSSTAAQGDSSPASVHKTPKPSNDKQKDRQQSKDNSAKKVQKQSERRPSKEKEARAASKPATNDGSKTVTGSTKTNSAGDSGKPKSYAPLSSLFSSVVYVMSGYQNPKRAQLRDKMTAMGANYKTDWDKTCTHLVCAFTNTPKYNEAKGHGKIVSHRWVDDCHSDKKKLSWKRYRLDANSVASDDSEEEVWAEELRPPPTSSAPASSSTGGNNKQEPLTAGRVGEAQSTSKQKHNDRPSDSGQDYGGDTSEEDTDDEINRVMERNKNLTSNGNAAKTASDRNGKPGSESDHEYSDDTDEDCNNGTNKQVDLPPLPSPFRGDIFFLHGHPRHEESLRRYIVAYDGQISEYMDSTVRVVITDKKWDQEFDDAVSSNPVLQFLRPAWVWACSDASSKVPVQQYAVSRH